MICKNILAFAVCIVAACRPSETSSHLREVISPFKPAALGNSINVVNGQFFDSCVDSQGKDPSREIEQLPWNLDVRAITSRDELSSALELGESFLLAGINKGVFSASASQRSKKFADIRLSPTHRWYLVSVTGGPKLTSNLGEMALKADLAAISDGRKFRHQCKDYYVGGVSLTHYAHILIGFDVESAATPESVTSMLKQNLGSSRLEQERLQQFVEKLNTLGSIYPATVSILDTSLNYDGALSSGKDLKKFVDTLTTSAGIDNAKVSHIKLFPYALTSADVGIAVERALAVNTKLAADYRQSLIILDSLSYLVDLRRGYKTNDTTQRAFDYIVKVDAALSMLRAAHKSCSELSKGCVNPDLSLPDLANVQALRPQISKVSRRPECGAELYALGSGDVCAEKSPKVYILRENPECGVALFNLRESEACGIKAYKLAEHEDCGRLLPPEKGYKSCRTHKNGVDSYFECRDQSHGVQLYSSCRVPSNGLELQPCRDPIFGVELYKECAGS